MMEGVLAADKVEAARGKWQRCAVAIHPGDVRHFALRLGQHAERAVEADEPRVRRWGSVGNLLVAGAARAIEQRQARGRPAPGQKRYELGVGRFLAMRRAVVEFRDRVVIDARGSLHPGPPQDRHKC
jgi:hypothetical protein